MVSRQRLIKFFVVFLALWFFAGLILLSVPNPALPVCVEKCSAAGFDIVLSANANQCFCKNSISRVEMVIEIIVKDINN